VPGNISVSYVLTGNVLWTHSPTSVHSAEQSVQASNYDQICTALCAEVHSSQLAERID